MNTDIIKPSNLQRYIISLFFQFLQILACLSVKMGMSFYVKKMLKYGKGLQVPNIIPTFACRNQDIVLR